MAKVRAKDLREKTDQELVDQFNLERKKIFDAIVRGSSGEAIKPHEKREGRRLIARIQTLLRERALRKALGGEIAVLEPKAAGASPAAARLLKAEPNPQRARARAEGLGLACTAPDRAALRLAEARRVRAGLTRTDPGESK
jgi:ribosomal protein L29